MARPRVTRKVRFRMALAVAEMSAAQWAKRNGVSTGHLSQVLSERHKSEPLEKKIDEFATKQLAAVA